MRSRPTTTQYFLDMASLVASRSTCLSRQVGCVLVNERNHVVATGYNGPASGLDHCDSCKRSGSGKDDDLCPATHAEQNALLQCHDVYEARTLYVTTSPCITCTKLLLNTGITRIIFREEYPHPAAKILWEGSGRHWIKHEPSSLLVPEM